MMSNDNLTRLLTDQDKGITKTHGSNGVLSRLWRQMLKDMNIGPSKFGALLQSYILDPRNRVPNNRKDQISTRGNLTKEFARPQMTWKVFCKALRFLNINKIKFVIEAYHANGQVSLHSTMVNFGTNIPMEIGSDHLPAVECLDEKVARPIMETTSPIQVVVDKAIHTYETAMQADEAIAHKPTYFSEIKMSDDTRKEATVSKPVVDDDVVKAMPAYFSSVRVDSSRAARSLS